jgi:hypothetical protein
MNVIVVQCDDGVSRCFSSVIWQDKSTVINFQIKEPYQNFVTVVVVYIPFMDVQALKLAFKDTIFIATGEFAYGSQLIVHSYKKEIPESRTDV